MKELIIRISLSIFMFVLSLIVLEFIPLISVVFIFGDLNNRLYNWLLDK